MSNELTLVGALSIAIVALTSVITFVSRQLWIKLFDADKGLATKVVERHLKYVDENAGTNRLISEAVVEIKQTLTRTAQAAEKHEETSEKICEMLGHQHQELLAFSGRYHSADEYSTVKTNEAIHHLTRAARSHLDGHDDECRRELDEAERAVNGRREPQH